MNILQKRLPVSLSVTQRGMLAKVLPFVSVAGLLWLINRVLSAIALNNWRLKRSGKTWVFNGTEELAVVTGGSAGFGRLITKGLAPKMRVVVLDVVDLPEDLKTLPSVTFHRCDLTSFAAIASTCAEIKSTYGNPSILINNAGIATSHSLLETSDEWVEKLFRVNTLSHFSLIREFLPGMLASQKGHIVEIASVASHITAAGLVDYSATKAAVLALFDGLRSELVHRYPTGHTINTTIVCPMWARTAVINDWKDSLAAHKAPVLEPEQVADPVVEQVLAGRSGYIYVPAHSRLTSAFAGFPVWLQDLLTGPTAKLTVPNPVK